MYIEGVVHVVVDFFCYVLDFISNELKDKWELIYFNNAIYIESLFLLVGTYIVEYDYTAKSSDELTIRKGDIITDAVPSEEGWLKGECRGTIGWV